MQSCQRHILLVLLVSILVNSSVLMASTTGRTQKSNTWDNMAIQSNGGETTPIYGGTLRIGIAEHLPGTLNPLIDYVSSVLVTAMATWRNIFSCLVGFDEGGSVIPDLAESWDVSLDGCNYTLDLFQNVTWHDGFRFNASDVKFTFDIALNDPEVEPLFKEFVQELNISSIDILNEYAVSFILQNSSASFISKIGWIPIIPWHLYAGTDLTTNPYNDNPIGTGPFEFVSWTPGTNITLSAYETYYKGRPYLDKIVIQRYGSWQELPDLLLNNEIDMIPNNVDPHRIEELSQVIGVSIMEMERPAVILVVLNFSNPILVDPTVRRALSYAINRTEICEIAQLGHAVPSKGPVPPLYSDWHNPNVIEYDYNKTLAEVLLDEAGYPRDNETGLRFDLSFRGTPSAGTDLIFSHWQEVGVNITITSGVSVPWDWRMLGWVWDFNDPHDLSYLYHSNGAFNYGGYSNSTVDYLFEQGDLTFNHTLRKEIYNELQLLLTEDLPSIFIIHGNSSTAWNNDFHGFPKYPFAGNDPFVLRRVWYDPTLSGQGRSPVKVCFADEQGRRTGFYNGSIVEQIPNSTYDEEANVVKIRSPLGKYTIDILGTGNGSYSLEIVNVASDYKHTKVPTNNIHEGETEQYFVEVKTDNSIYIFDAAVDLNSDFIVDIFDAVTLSNAFDAEPGEPNWNCNADINNNNIVDIFDAIILANNFGEEWEP